MKKIVYTIAILATLVSCSKNDTPAEEIQSSPLIIKEATMSLLETRANFADDVEVGVRLDGTGYNSAKKYTYAFGKYTAPGQIDPGATPCWNGKTADDGIMLHVPGKLTAFVPSCFEEARTADAENNILLKTQMYDDSRLYSDKTNPDICVAKDIDVSGTKNTIDLKLKHVYSSIEFKFTKDRSFQSADGKLQTIKMIGTGLGYERKFNTKTFQWGECSNEQLPNRITLPFTDFTINGESTNGVTTLKLLVPPFTITDTNGLYVIFIIDAIPYGLQIPPEKFTGCDGNTKYKFNLMLKDGIVSILSISTNEWADYEVSTGKLPLNTEP